MSLKKLKTFVILVDAQIFVIFVDACWKLTVLTI